ncbi:MAG: NAD-dependent epimerase/dehydratase family protein [Bacteroidales bacterium]|nr:NAD-dependent epimerase/dehydratase family protein [Bacteroidales bacterium]
MLHKIGITGQNGFIGSHLFRYFKQDKNRFKIIPFKDDYFSNENNLKDWVVECDVIIHLAALSRHEKPLTVYETNISLVSKLISALNNAQSSAHIIFSSSIQENINSEYGKSKKEGRELLIKWCKKNNLPFTGLLFPNVFGPFAKPYYASVIATFSHQLIHNKVPQIIEDACLDLIFIDELVQIISEIILNKKKVEKYIVPYSYQIKVSNILKLLEYYNECYIINGITPSLNNNFEYNLFYTFKSYLPQIKK